MLYQTKRYVPTAIIALCIQLIAITLVSLAALSNEIIVLSIFSWSLIQGILAGLISYLMQLPLWWIPIHLVFVPLMIVTLTLDIASIWFLIIFLCLFVIYGKTYQTQVPLYLSSQQVHHALGTLLPPQGTFSFIDLGSGFGGLLSNLASIYKNGIFHGIESAPLPFIISWIKRASCTENYKISWGDFWKCDLSQYDIVYAYLSPVPMESLWQKAKKEMRPGTLLISNTFVIPGVSPDQSIELNDFSGSTLHLWKL